MGSSQSNLESIKDLEAGGHACFFYEEEEEHRAVLAEVLRSGLERGDKVLYLLEDHDPVTVMNYIADDRKGNQREGENLAFSRAEEIFLAGGTFDPDRVINWIEKECERTLAQGYNALRITGEMTWSLKGESDLEKLVKFESRLNNLLQSSRCFSLCQYDKRRFKPDILSGILNAHPVIIDGTLLYENFFYRPTREILQAEGSPSMFSYQLRRLRDYWEAREELSRSERYFRALAENAYDVITVLKADGTRVYASPSVKRVTGYDPEEMVGRTPFELMHPDDLPQVMKTFSEGLRSPGFTKKVEYRFRHKDGTWHTHEAVGWNLLEDPDVGAVVINYRDISERKRLEQELLERSEELEAFAHSVSHDLQGTLTSIDGFSQTALRAFETGDGDLERESLDHVIKAARHMESYIDALLLYAKAGFKEGAPVHVDLEEILMEVLTDLEEHITRKGAQVTVDDELPTVMAYPVKLQQVFLNLVDNAVKHMGDPPDPHIEIGVTREPGEFVIYVRDNGVGIPLDKQEAVFLPLERLAGAEIGGIGIGLPAVKRAVESWGGRAWVESTPGKGATFFFTVPAAD